MTEDSHSHENEDLQSILERITYLLRKYRLVEGLVRLQDSPRQDLVGSIIQKQNLASLQNVLEKLHPADIAHILEVLPLEDRLFIWGLVKTENDGEVLLEVSDGVRETLIADMGSSELVAAAEQLDAD